MLVMLPVLLVLVLVLVLLLLLLLLRVLPQLRLRSLSCSSTSDSADPLPLLGRLRPRRLHTRPRSSHEASGSPAVTRSTEMVHVYACVGKLLSVRSMALLLCCR